jgi:hypothetical protein
MSLVYERTYLLMAAPGPVIDLARELLDVQAVEYQVIPDCLPTDKKARSLTAVRWGNSWCVAQEVEVNSA